ncbi:MAG: peptide-methionine (S)-S-oxide reductase MsrA [Candidatus Acidiferrales bacterium]
MRGRFLIGLGFAAVILVVLYVVHAAPREPVPPAKVDAPLAATSGKETAVFAGGCFWGTQAVFERVRGVVATAAGYAGGAAATATYDQVSAETTGHAESVQVVYDPSRITYGQLLRVFFSVAHDPTELNRQGPDVGTSYRSAIFYTNDEQKRVAAAYIGQLDAAKVFGAPIVTEVTPLKGFYRAEDYHQDYALHNPGNPYIQICDLPKVRALKSEFPDLFVDYKGKSALWGGAPPILWLIRGFVQRPHPSLNAGRMGTRQPPWSL